ncbi:MAG TPA: GNAT family N-acetyltransferase [Acidimicrobiales bacterium]|nr:GNAT family N-acetyltransferase [Acidimicrobiales bacterium]
MTGAAARIELIEVDDVIVGALLGGGTTPLDLAVGFPRTEDVQALQGFERGALSFLIAVDGVVVGTCGTHGPPNADGVLELGWGLVASARGRGVGTAAVTQLLDRARRRYPTATIVAHTEWSDTGAGLLADSAASESLLDGLGFVADPPPDAPGYRAWRLAG